GALIIFDSDLYARCKGNMSWLIQADGDNPARRSMDIPEEVKLASSRGVINYRNSFSLRKSYHWLKKKQTVNM
ncbi:hypothetical protein KKI90_21660, partial [Xenorhabdus bovienii]|uniref:hypothetical protein n=1 Tax=Xenorhabdus bovienii TaxID=40576 RepID=UPI00237C8F9F